MTGSRLMAMALAVCTAALLLSPSFTESHRVTFTVWGMPFEDRLFLDGYAKGFEQANPGITVGYQRHSDPNMKYYAWHSLGRGPEVMRIQVPDYLDMVRRGMLEPLDRYIQGPEGLSDSELGAIPRRLLEAMRVNGRIYALPEDNAVFGLYYNKDLFDEAGVAHPGSFWTWEDLRATARKLTRRDAAGRAIVHGLDMQIWQWPFMHFYAQTGGRQWSEDGLTTLINTGEAGVRALEFLHSLAYEDGSWEPYFGKDQGTGPDSRFANGAAAMYLDGSWMAPSFESRNPRLRFGITLPTLGESRVACAGSCLWGISAHARNKDEGWRMLRWLISPEQALRYWDTLRVAPPANTGVVNSAAFRSTHGIPKEGGQWEVPPMPGSLFADRAAWLLEAFRPDPRTGLAPAFVATSLYQRTFEDEVARMLRLYLESPRGPSAREVLDRAAHNIHQVIDRDREARRLPPVQR